MFAADFWPMFWTILGTGAVVTVALCFVVAIIPVPRTGRRRQPPAELNRHRPPRRPTTDLPHAA